MTQNSGSGSAGSSAHVSFPAQGRPPEPMQKFFSADDLQPVARTALMEISGSGSLTQSLHSPTSPLCSMRNNEVRTVMLHGVAIVALVMENTERLCLAQISNTLLKNFSYNEIHNRRVALGITCVQCTPVQLELLRRAGAMPVSSRRCGMITKREAERLCKSFLAETVPPKLPDSFSFDVYHHCAWGCRGAFNPSRYNSSRAKCIKCCYCGLFFSPNKFIFHSHRLPDSKYVQPDAANFNSWRRHIKLSASPPDEIMFAWEDVKAMFNGGSRKRAMAASLTSVSKQQQQRRQQQQQQQQATRILLSEEGGHESPGTTFAPTAVKRARRTSVSPEASAERGISQTKNSPSSTTSSGSSGSCGGIGNPQLGPQGYPFPLIPLHGNKAYGALIHGLASAPSPFSQSSLSHLSSPSPPHAPTLLPAHSPPHSFKGSVSDPGQADVRQSFAELMGSSLLLPYNYFQLSRYWPRSPASAPTQVLDMSNSTRHGRLAFGINEAADALPSPNSLAEKGLTGSAAGQMWERGQQSQRSSLSHGSSAFKPVSKNSTGPNSVLAKGSSFRAENLIGSCTRALVSPADSGHSEDEENEVDVIGGEGDAMMREDGSGRRHRRDSASSPLLVRQTESSSHIQSYEGQKGGLNKMLHVPRNQDSSSQECVPLSSVKNINDRRVQSVAPQTDA